MRQTIFGLFVVFAAACSASADDGSPVDHCSGNYTCSGGGDTVMTTLRKEGSSCTAGKLTLRADGTVSGVDGATWTGTSHQFKVCADGDCLTCTSEGNDSSSSSGSSSSSSSSGKCTGSPDSCTSNSPPNCSYIRGCYMGTRLKWDNSFDNYCTGSPDSCDEMTDETSCSRQGCTWKK